MPRIVQFSLPYDEDLENQLHRECPGWEDFRILSQSLDARGAPRGRAPTYLYRLEVIFKGERFSVQKEEFKKLGPLPVRPIIVGAGPAGLFCALRFAEYGIPTLIIERGEKANQRMKSIARFWRYGQLNPESNVCYGEGGAGLFSDGKLITRIKSPYVNYVMNRLVDFGAPPETAYLSNPHLGSNKIRVLITKMSEFLISQGHEIRSNTRVEKLIVKDSKIEGVLLNNGEEVRSNHVILATGHSAKEIYFHLNDLKVAMKPKDFAVGVRVEHPRHLIDTLQYGAFAGAELGAARYRLSYASPETQKGTFSFCMCPGGHVLSSGTDKDGLVVNGMSNFARNSPWSNSALVVSVKAGEDFKTDQVLNGHNYQRTIEKKAYEYSREFASGREIPAIRLSDFLDGKNSTTLPKTSCPSGIFPATLDKILPATVNQHLRTALIHFERQMKGFVSKEALFLAPETRTSAPVTVQRDPLSLESSNVSGLYPCGEGAGYAGGITSAAVDGVKAAMAIIKKSFELS